MDSDALTSSQPSYPKSRILLFLLIAVSGFAADLWTKHWVFDWLGMPPGQTYWIWEGYVGIQTALNPGALFGMGAEIRWIFPILSILAAVGIIFWLFAAGAAKDLYLTGALSSVTGGIFGNLYDRLGLWHAPNQPDQWHNEVRDWILFSYGEHVWPNFNIADCLLVCGACLLVWRSFYDTASDSASAKPVSGGS